MNKSSRPVSPAGHEGGTPPPFALTEFLERCMGNVEIATLLLGKFEKQLTTDVVAIQECLAARDTEQIARTAHALKGAAGAVAAATLLDLASEIESLSRSGQLDAIAGELSSLTSEVARCLDYLPAARAGLAAKAAGESTDPGTPQ